MDKKPITEIRIHKTWNNPIEHLSQCLVFHELEKVTREGEFIEMDLKNLKTRFSAHIRFHADLLNDMLREKNET